VLNCCAAKGQDLMTTTTLPVIPTSIRTHDNTMFSDHARCPRLYYWRHIRGIIPDRTAPALQFGGVLHDGLELFYKGVAPAEVLDRMKEKEDFIEPVDDHRTMGRALVTIAEYMTHYGDDPSFKVLFTEMPFEIEDDDGFRYGGIIDLTVQWQNGVWVEDHKSTSRGGPTYWDQFTLNPQPIGYVWAARLLHGRKIMGFLINQLLVHKNKKPVIQQFARRSYIVSDWQLEEWKRMTIYRYHEIARNIEEDYFPPRWDHCFNKYGQCAYFALCRTPESAREAVIEHEYKENRWHWEDR
jgi:hypothetical protein